MSTQQHQKPLKVDNSQAQATVHANGNADLPERSSIPSHEVGAAREGGAAATQENAVPASAAVDEGGPQDKGSATPAEAQYVAAAAERTDATPDQVPAKSVADDPPDNGSAGTNSETVEADSALDSLKSSATNGPPLLFESDGEKMAWVPGTQWSIDGFDANPPVFQLANTTLLGSAYRAPHWSSAERATDSTKGLQGDDTGLSGPTLETAFVEANLVPGDQYFDLQWHLHNTGQAGGTPGVDINVLGVWDDYTGSGVTIGVVDTGVQFDHPDLLGQFNTLIDYDAWDQDDDPSAEFGGPNGENHATAVSGTIAAIANNGIGVVGAAFDADLVIYRMEFGANTEFQVADNMWHQVDVDISSNSWGFSGFFEDDFSAPLTDPIAQAGAGIENAVEFGRDGFGTVFVFAAGNGREEGQDVNYHSFQNSPYTIAVGGIDANGELASFSNPGAALLLSAPAVGIVTTDRTGADGFIAGDDYIAISGTSFSAPLVSSVVALMLEANPELGYRDVQEILAYSSPLTDPDNSGWSSSGWNYNGATNWNGGGLHFSHDYGFGMLDAHAAVRLAETWEGSATYSNLVTSTYQWNGSPTAIPDANGRNNKPGVLESTITVTEGLDIDHVVVSLDLSHNWIGDLIITLTSPDGTVSRLVDRPGVWILNPFGSPQKEIVFDLSSTQHWGEEGVGDWTLTIYDAAPNDTGVLNDWSLTLWGDPITADDVYIYTDEFGTLAGSSTTSTTSGSETLVSGDGSSLDDGSGTLLSSIEESSLDEAAPGGEPGPPGGGGGGGGGGGKGNGGGKDKGGGDGGGGTTDRGLLVDSDGGTDTINAAAVTSDTTLDLQPGATSSIAGGSLTIDAATTIENAFLGDGNDTVFGNAADNSLDGGRGDDWLQGREGADTLTGGPGADIFVLEAGGGGATASEADLILDFEDGTDTIGLDGLNAADLSFDSSADVTGDGAVDTVISAAGEFLAVVSDSTMVDQNDVQTVTPLV